MTATAEPRLTARQWAAIMREPLKDRSYQLTKAGSSVTAFLAFKQLSRRSERTLDSIERTLARLVTLHPEKTMGDFASEDILDFLAAFNPPSRPKHRSHLADADLAYADLARANLAYADLADANLARANLARAKGLIARRVSDLHILYDQPGPVRAYKLVTSAGEGPYNGGIRYEVGGSYEVMDADADEARDCGPGINLATLPWCCREWRPGYRILLCEFEAGDIAAVPIGGGGKFRVRRCRVVGEINLAELGLGDTTDLEAE